MREYIITGINQLTGEREELTPALSLLAAEEALLAETVRRRRRRRKCAYIHLRIEVFNPYKLSLWK